MRIEAYNQVAQLYQTSNTKNVTQTAETNGMGRDEVQITSTGRDYHVAKAAVSEAADVREDLKMVLMKSAQTISQRSYCLSMVLFCK